MRRATTPDLEEEPRSREARVRRLAQAFVTDEAMAALRHDLLSHLTGIGTVTYLLRKHVDDGELPATEPVKPPRERRGGDLLRMIKEQVTAATSKLQRRMIGAPDRAVSEAPLAACAARARASLLNAEGVVVTLTGDDDGARMGGRLPLIAAANDVEVEIAMGCLLENAIEAVSSEHGDCEASPGSSKRDVRVTLERVTSAGDEPEVAFVVEDGGAGFDEGASARAFDAFYTTKKGHLGLGLTVARRIAQRWGGSVVIEGGGPGAHRVALRLPALPPSRRSLP